MVTSHRDSTSLHSQWKLWEIVKGRNVVLQLDQPVLRVSMSGHYSWTFRQNEATISSYFALRVV